MKKTGKKKKKTMGLNQVLMVGVSQKKKKKKKVVMVGVYFGEIERKAP